MHDGCNSTEEFETADLKSARTLLEDLRLSRSASGLESLTEHPAVRAWPQSRHTSFFIFSRNTTRQDIGRQACSLRIQPRCRGCFWSPR